jgi:hypothetical protein
VWALTFGIDFSGHPGTLPITFTHFVSFHFRQGVSTEHGQHRPEASSDDESRRPSRLGR